MTGERRIAVSIAALIFGLVSSMTYLCERLYERLHYGKANPRAVLEEAHAGFYWRAFLAAWWGGLIAILIYRRLAGGSIDTSRLVTRLTYALLILSPVAALWAYRFP